MFFAKSSIFIRCHAGPKTWEFYHGPRLRQAAQFMDSMDKYDQDSADWMLKKRFVIENRDKCLQRTYARRSERLNLEKTASWAAYRKPAGELHELHEAPWNDLEWLPRKALKQILTPCILEKDQEAISCISKKLIAEEQREALYKDWQKMRRENIKTDLKRRRLWNDMLTEMAGQV